MHVCLKTKQIHYKAYVVVKDITTAVAACIKGNGTVRHVCLKTKQIHYKAYVVLKDITSGHSLLSSAEQWC
jgi:hypothetical protein